MGETKRFYRVRDLEISFATSSGSVSAIRGVRLRFISRERQLQSLGKVVAVSL